MDGLSSLDKVAYVRFASVYKNFKEAKDFEQFVGNLDDKNHNKYLDIAFQLAEINLGKTNHNPSVGCCSEEWFCYIFWSYQKEEGLT